MYYTVPLLFQAPAVPSAWLAFPLCYMYENNLSSCVLCSCPLSVTPLADHLILLGTDPLSSCCHQATQRVWFL